MRSKERKRKKELQVRWLERFIAPSYASKSGIDKQRRFSETLPNPDNRAASASTAETGNQHTLGHIDCPACLTSKAEAMQENDLASLVFPDAARIWLERHSLYIKQRTIADYKQYIAALTPFFCELPLNEIHIGHVREFHKGRLLPLGMKREEGRAGASRVRMESSTLRQIMTEAGCWKNIKGLYKHPPLSRREKEGAGKSFSLEQQDIFLRVAFDVPRCELAAHCIQVMFRGGFGFGELSQVRRYEFDVEGRTVEITDGAKNDEERRRIVPLSESAFRSMMWILGRWEELGGTEDDQFLLPHRNRNFYRPMVSIQNGWNSIMGECIKRGLLPASFRRRIYDCRVTAVTRALSSGRVSIHTAQKLFGHVSRKMQKRYYKPDMDILRDAVEVLEAPPKRAPQSVPVQKQAELVSS